ncbi:ShlB/FhaC/HecB family hemolysin secretion/activation protein [Gilliamella sp. B2889]|uniref:ShlB/FhaC/HecB family hemolysin secretion/activation protein n=1 Tax=Gilliamella sp. B2889 TaxID=2817985 RepID=UPI00226AAD14|nr:ShlB/FhaC/HecB family hemolysin secretion/activation protein [Gilliamella sp. B2889]MCX8683300.1 ShlB/FhaC/HecB family hemolysin secretion/activation protein [Gilliamella sp. B2889]
MMNVRKLSVIVVGFILVGYVEADSQVTNQNQKVSDKQLIYQQERQKAAEEALSPKTPDVNLLSPLKKINNIDFPEEKLCFPIAHVKLLEKETLPFYVPLSPLTKQAEGRCLGTQGLNLLMTELQNQLINYGFITTRVVAPQQDLSQGTFTLLILKGSVKSIHYSKDSDTYANLYTSIPLRSGELLNLRSLEQGLENLQRIPTVDAKIELIPGAKEGETEIVIKRNQSKFWRVGMSVDNSGTKDTGRYLGGLTFYLDNPLGFSDSFYVSGDHDLENKDKYGNRDYYFSYSIPYGYWMFDALIYGNTYHQNIPGIVDYQYKGRSKNYNFKVSRVLHRSSTQKTTLSYGINLRQSHNFMNDLELENQRRKTTNWKLGLQHRHYINDMTLDVDVWYQKGVRWFGAEKAREEEINIASALTNIFKFDISFYAPFNLGNQNFAYSVDYNGQMTRGNKLTPPDRFSIGSRWTVRGFDGEQMLTADNGWYLRNDLIWQMPIRQQLYFGLDAGQVSGRNSERLSGKRLVGSALGIRGQQFNVYYDVFAGVPLHKPNNFKTNHLTVAFYLNWTY